MKTLFKNCSILAPEGVIKNGYLGIDGKLIDYVGQDRPVLAYDKEKDMSGKLLMPGLINAHGHASMVLLRGVGSGLGIHDWLNNAIIPIEDKMTPEDIAAGTRAAMLEMLASGTTCFSEMYDFPWADAKAIAEAGMKANITRCGLCFDDNVDLASDKRFNECVDFIGWCNAAPEFEDLIKPEFSLHSEYLTKEKFVRGIAEKAAELGCGINVHVSETESEHIECIIRHGKTPVAYLNDCGILDSRTYMAHCVWVSDEDLDIMQQKGVSMVHNPSSNLKLGSGTAPVKEALERNINIAIGTDGAASNNNLNMFEEMHLAALICSGVNRDPLAVSASQILDMGTIGGAKALGRTDTGALKPGNKADIAALDMNAVHLIPDINTKELLVYSAQGSDVCMTMVNGRVLYENGEYTTLDEEKILAELVKTVEKLGVKG